MVNDALPVSPFSTGGGGYQFEFMVATSYVISLLRMEIARGLERGIVQVVGLQQRNRGHPLDDVIVTTMDDGLQRRTLSLQVKHTLRFTNNAGFREVMQDCWAEFSREDFAVDGDRIGVAIGEITNVNRVRDIQELLQWARTSADAQAFYDKARSFKSKRKCLDLFEAVLREASGEALSEAGVWVFLQSFVVVLFDFNGPGSRDLVLCFDQLLPLVQDRSPEQAEQEFGLLYRLVSEFEAAGGEIDADVLAREIPSSIRLAAPSAISREFRPMRQCLIDHLDRQLSREKNSKRYIPDVFVEVSQVKDKARFFAHPVLFLDKGVENINRLDFGPLNRILNRLSQDPIYPKLPDGFEPSDTMDEVEDQCSLLLDVLQETKRALGVFSESSSDHTPESMPPEKRYAYESVKFPLWAMSTSLGREIDACIDDLSAARSRVLFITARAGQGKTNFVCDFADNVLRTRSLPCLFFSGQELRRVDPDEIGKYMVTSVFGNTYRGNMDRMLTDLERVARKNQAPMIIIIDGLTEHEDISAFSQRLERLVERLLEYKFIKLILTCRSEYFNERFQNFTNASFSDEIYFVTDLERHIRQTHKDHLVSVYFRFFKISCPYLSSRAEESLKSDPLLLRFFCEVYGDHTVQNTVVLPQVTDVYRDELFRKYWHEKLERVSQRYARSSDLRPGARARYQKALKHIIQLMIEQEQFADIPVADLDEEHHAALGEMFGEDIILRKDLVEGRSVLDEKSEVINFTFDEFRDFLLADYLAKEIFEENSETFESIVERFTVPSSPVAEGIRKFIFFAAKRPESRELLSIVERLSWYRESFLECIFSVQEDLITEDDLRAITSRFHEDSDTAWWIFQPLVRRYRTDFYPVLNINLLFQILDRLDEAEYDRLVRAPLTERRPYREKTATMWTEVSAVELLADWARAILTDDDLSRHPCFENLAELLIYLFDIQGSLYVFPAVNVFREFARLHADVAIDLLQRHTTIRIPPVREKVSDLLDDLPARDDTSKEPTDTGDQPSSELGDGEDTEQRPEYHSPQTGPKALTVELLDRDRPQYLIVLKRGWNKPDFLKAAGVSAGSYAEELMERIYNCLVTDALDLQEEYQGYYSVEYADLETFLYWKYGVDKATTARVLASLKPGDSLGYGSAHSGGEYNLGQFMLADTTLEILTRVFDEIREANDEDQA